MSKDINLAGKIEKVGFPHERVIFLRKISIIVAIATSILAVLIFLISFQFSASSAQAEQARINSELIPYQKKINEVKLVKERIGQIKILKEERDKKFSKVDKIVSEKPSSVSLDSVNIEEKSTIISFKASSLEEMNQLISNLKNVKFNQNEKIKISELKLLPGQGYFLSVTIE